MCARHKKEYNGQSDLFQITSCAETKQAAKNSEDSKVFVSRMNYVSSAEENVSDIFSGFNELYVITYSYGLREISRIMTLFDKGEVIVGCANMVNFSLAELIANQNYVIKECAHKNQYLVERIEKEEFKFFVLDSIVSHEKVYLLKGDGNYRTILSSANFSGAAWGGKQRENIVVCDDKECFDVYMERFNKLKENCSAPIVKDAKIIGDDGENIEEIPIIKKARREGVLLLDVSDQSKEIQEYDFYIAKATPEIKNFLAKGNIKAGADKMIEITAEKIEKIIVESKKEQKKSAERKIVFPKFEIDYNDNVVSLNDKQWDLNPSEEDVSHDIELLKKYMDGFNPDMFIGNVAKLRSIYWKTLIYMFASPFIAKIRHEIGNDDWLRYCPVYLLLSGSTDAGKTAFVKLVRKMMFNIRYSKPLLNNKYFSTEQSANIKLGVKGFPALIDEVTPAQWRTAVNIVKNDADLIENHHVNHPCFVLIANDLNGVRPEISKRVMVFNPECRMPRDLAMKNGGIVKSIGDQIGNSLYRLFVRKMLEKLPEFIESIANKKEAPDIWKLASGILREIFDYFDAFPEFQQQTWHDYVGEKNICDKAISILTDEYGNNPEIFKAHKKANKLYVDFSMYDSNEAGRMLTCLDRELPTIFKCKRMGNQVIIDLKAAEDFTGMKFTQGKFTKFYKKMCEKIGI